MSKLRYKRQKHNLKPGYISMVTSNVKHAEPAFIQPSIANIFIQNLNVTKHIKGFKLYAFCLLPDHFHLLVKPNSKYHIGKIMQSLKRNCSEDINRYYHKHVICNRFTWQKSYYQRIIDSDQYFENAYMYVSNNHLKHGLSREWRYCSEHYPVLIDDFD